VLQRHCADRGLDFQVVNLRWGVTDDVINDHQVSGLCLREIATCQRLSVGPNFVVSNTLLSLNFSDTVLVLVLVLNKTPKIGMPVGIPCQGIPF